MVGRGGRAVSAGGVGVPVCSAGNSRFMLIIFVLVGCVGTKQQQLGQQPIQQDNDDEEESRQARKEGRQADISELLRGVLCNIL